jgi:sulfur-carrier protein
MGGLKPRTFGSLFFALILEERFVCWISICGFKVFQQGCITVNFHIYQYSLGMTLEIKVRFFTSLRELVGKREENITFANDQKVTVNSALGFLAKKYGNPFCEYLYEAKTGQPKNFLQFLINGASTSTLNGQQTELKDQDVLAILPPVGGG